MKEQGHDVLYYENIEGGRVEAMRGNHRTLTDVGRRVQTGAGWFSQAEHQNTEDVSRITDAYPQLVHLSVPELIGAAGGDPLADR